MSDHATTDDTGSVIDTSRMSPEKRAALETAEGARERVANGGLAAQLFMGRFAHELLADFPVQTDDDRRIGDALCERVGAVLRERIDPEAVDATRTIPEDAVRALAELGVFAMKVPREYGGLGLSLVNYNRVMMRIASWCGSTAVLVSAHQSIGVPNPLKLFGTPEQKARWFPRSPRLRSISSNIEAPGEECSVMQAARSSQPSIRDSISKPA